MKESEFDVIIIGAGIGGLVAGCLLARRGRKVLILEQGKKAGGYAQNFRRGGFTFDATLHSMNGPRADNLIACLISECGIKDKVEFLEQKTLYRLITPDFSISVKNADWTGYISKIKELFPHEKRIEHLFSEVLKVFESVERLGRSRLPYLLNILLFPILYPKLVRYDRLTVEQFFRKFVSDERLIASVSALWSFFSLPPGRLAFSYFFFPFVDYLRNGGFVVKGGSESLARALVDSLTDAGGKVMLNSEVTGIITVKNRAVGVRTKDASYCARAIISNISPLRVIDMVEGGRLRADYLRKVQSAGIALSGVQVYIGLDCKLQALGASPEDYIIVPIDNYDLESQYRRCLEGDLRNSGGGFGITLYSNMDSSMAPEGKSTLGLFNLCGANQWFKMSENEYRKKKTEVTEVLIEKAEKHLPGLSANISVAETATPRTMHRYTANPYGSYHGFEQTVAQAGMLRRFSRKYPIKGLYQVGAWTFPGGGYGGVMFSAGQLVKRFF